MPKLAVNLPSPATNVPWRRELRKTRPDSKTSVVGSRRSKTLVSDASDGSQEKLVNLERSWQNLYSKLSR